MTRGERLSVWMHERHVATLVKQRERLSLAYTAEALAAYDANTPLLSVALPVLPGSFRHATVRPFFDGLLPEGDARRMLAHDFRVDPDDTFGLLRALGRDCAGALVLLPEGEAPPSPAATPPVPLTLDQVARRLQQLATEPLGVDRQVRISLAGVQRKLVLTRLATGDWALPVGGLPSTHILKRGNPDFPAMVANEAFCMELGRQLAMQVAATEVLQLHEPTLVVTRYDRAYVEDGHIARIHQEDLAQALGLEASAKYEDRGGPGLRRLARLLREETRGLESLEHLLDITLLNMVVGNADAHAKNFSLLHPRPGRVELAPAYDVMSTALYPRADVRPGLYVNGKASIHEVTSADVGAEAIAWGLSGERVAERIGRHLARLPAAIVAASRLVPDAPAGLLALVEARAAAFGG